MERTKCIQSRKVMMQYGLSVIPLLVPFEGLNVHQREKSSLLCNNGAVIVEQIATVNSNNEKAVEKCI